MTTKINCSEFVQAEYEKIVALARFTDEQRGIFDLLNEDKLNDEGIMLKMNLSRKRYYKVKKIVLQKVIKILPNL